MIVDAENKNILVDMCHKSIFITDLKCQKDLFLW